MKILIGTNLLTSVNANVYANHSALYYHLGRISAERQWQFLTMTPTRMSIDRMRNEAAKIALQQECDYLVFIDDDMLLLPHTIETLIDANVDIVMANTFIRGYPFHPMAFIRKDRTMDIRETPLVHFETVLDEAIDNLSECDAIGFATVAIKTHLLKELKAPWFVTSPTGTEDIYFCLRCKMELEHPVGVYVHTGVPTGHMLDNEFVGEDNVEKLRTLYRPKDQPETGKRDDRGLEYHNAILGVTNET